MTIKITLTSGKEIELTEDEARELLGKDLPPLLPSTSPSPWTETPWTTSPPWPYKVYEYRRVPMTVTYI